MQPLANHLLAQSSADNSFSIVIVSVVLSLPTTGPMLLGALKTQDVNLAATFLLFVAVLTVIGMLISDLALAALDPRIRFGATSEK